MFTVENIQNSNITWSHHSSLSYVSGQGTPNYRVTASNSYTSGEAWIEVTISNACSSSTKRFYTWAGRPEGISGNMSGPSNVSPGQVVWYSVPDESQEHGTFDWSTPHGFNITAAGDGTHHVQVWVGNRASSGYVQVWKTNECGNGGARYKFITVESGGGGGVILRAIPNPVINELNIKYADKVTGVTLTYDDFNSPVEYVVTDRNGTIVFTKNSKKTRLKLNLSHIRENGIYILNVYHGDGSCVEQVRLVIDR